MRLMAGLPENQNSVRVIEPAVGQSSKCSSRMLSGESVVITNGTACHSAGRECSDHKRHGVPHLNPAGHDGFGLSVL